MKKVLAIAMAVVFSMGAGAGITYAQDKKMEEKKADAKMEKSEKKAEKKDAKKADKAEKKAANPCAAKAEKK